MKDNGQDWKSYFLECLSKKKDNATRCITSTVILKQDILLSEFYLKKECSQKALNAKLIEKLNNNQ